MGIQAKLYLEDEEFTVLESEFSFEQNTYKGGRPSSFTEFKGIRMVIESKKGNPFFEWATTLKNTKQAELHLLPRILGSSKTRKIYLIDALCVSYKLNFSNSGSQPMTETIILSCGGVKHSDGETEYSAYWRETFPEQEVQSTTIDNNEPKFLGYHFENIKGEIIEQRKIRSNQKIELVIKTENSNGKTIMINLNDSRLDFIHNNKILKNDTLRGIIIDGEETRISLTAIKQ